MSQTLHVLVRNREKLCLLYKRYYVNVNLNLFKIYGILTSPELKCRAFRIFGCLCRCCYLSGYLCVSSFDEMVGSSHQQMSFGIQVWYLIHHPGMFLQVPRQSDRSLAEHKSSIKTESQGVFKMHFPIGKSNVVALQLWYILVLTPDKWYSDYSK